MKKLILVMVVGIVLMLSGCIDDEDSSSGTGSYKRTSSGEMCTWMKGTYNDGHEKIWGTSCPEGEICTKSQKDLDGDGLLCTRLETSEGFMQVCDGICK